MPPTFSIIIPAHNEENYIRPTLHALKLQTFQNFETIVVSNGCTDKTEEIVNKRVDDSLKHFTLPQANVSIARNYGARQAQGEVLVFLDADTSLQPDSLQKINQQFGSEHSVGTTLSLPDSQEFRYKFATAFKNFYHKAWLYQGCSGALICRRELFHDVGGYPEIPVKEHRKLILKLKKEGKFKCVDTYVTTSMRRYKKWGLTKSALYWTWQWMKNYVGDLKSSVYEKVR